MAIKDNNITEQIKIFTKILFWVKVLKFFLFLYSILSFVFWFLNCFEVDWIFHFEWLFKLPYKLVHNFYSPQGISADFTLAIIGCISLAAGFISEGIINFLYQRLDVLAEKEEKIRYEKQQKRNKRRTLNPVMPTPQNNYEPNYHEQEVKTQPTFNVSQFETSKLLFLIQPHVSKIKRKENELELTFQQVEIWKDRVNKKVLENISYSKPMQKGYYRKNLFIMYKDFNYIDDFLYYMKPTMDSIIIEFQKYGIQTTFSYVFSSIVKQEYLEKELDCMDTILSLNFIGEYVVTTRFKLTYDNKSIQQCTINLKGEYNLSKNLSISNKQALYVIEQKKN